MTKEDKNSREQKASISILSISIIVFLYFAIIILLSKLNYDAQLIRVIREMLTIPALILLGMTIAASLYLFIKNKFRINSFPFYGLLIQLVTIGLIVYIA